MLYPSYIRKNPAFGKPRTCPIAGGKNSAVESHRILKAMDFVHIPPLSFPVSRT